MRARLIVAAVALALVALVSWSINFNMFFATAGSSLMVGSLLALWYVKVRGRQPGDDQGSETQRFINKVLGVFIVTSIATVAAVMSAYNGAPFALAQIVENLCLSFLIWGCSDDYFTATRWEPAIVGISGILVTVVWQGIFCALPLIGVGVFS